MMISEFELYLLLKLDTIRIAMMVVGIVMGALGIIMIFANIIPEWKAGVKKRWFVVTFGTSIVFWIAFAAVPTTKQTMAIVVVPKVINSNFVQKDLPEDAKEVYATLKDWLIKQATEEMEPADLLDGEPVRNMEGYQLKKIIKKAVREELQAWDKVKEKKQ